MNLADRKKSLGFLKYMIMKVITTLFVSEKTYRRAFEKFNRVCAEYSESNTSTIAHTALTYREAVVWEKSWFSDSCTIPFEFLNVSVPKDYDKVLSKHYGRDYMEIPKEPPSTAHGEVFFDVNKPYTYYYKNGRKK